MPIFLGSHRPALDLGEHRFAVCVKQIVDRFPLDRIAFCLDYLDVLAPPVIALGIVEKSRPFAGEAPVNTCLVLVMPWAILCKHTLSVRPCNRM